MSPAPAITQVLFSNQRFSPVTVKWMEKSSDIFCVNNIESTVKQVFIRETKLPKNVRRGILLTVLIFILNSVFVARTLRNIQQKKSLSYDGPLQIVDSEFVEEIDTNALWYGEVSESTFRRKQRHGFHKYNVTMVISHCDKPVDWIWRDFLPNQHPLQNVIIYSKCGNAVQGAPANATIVRLPNVGRCDHTFAYHMKHMNSSETSPDDMVLFIKDNPRRMKSTRTLETMLHTASINGFCCNEQQYEFDTYRPSYYHDYSKLSKFSLEGWVREKRDKNHEFKSQYQNLGDWVDQLNISLPSPLMPVCYGGTFVATVSQISKQNPSWNLIEKSLSRGDNIEEGHFCERIWAGLLSKSLSKYALKKILEKSTEIMWDFDGLFCGTLAYRENLPGVFTILLVVFFFNISLLGILYLQFYVFKLNSKQIKQSEVLLTKC